MNGYDIIVIGAGHAGIEASFACARMGCATLLITLNKDTIGAMSCNPAIGGVGKGQLVKEIDALGGAMARAADACGMQFRILNASKGAAVQSSRAQIDMQMYGRYMKHLLKKQKNLCIKEAEAAKLIVEAGMVKGVFTAQGQKFKAGAVIISCGTFLNGLIHVGLKNFSAGRINEPAAKFLAQNLMDLGFKTMRFKTGTCPRLDKNSIDFSGLTVQEGDDPARPFSFFNKRPIKKQAPCYITYTNTEAHKIILDNLNRSPLYTGKINATGVRYCPSIEDKVVRFSGKERHQIFLEPQGFKTDEVYPNGLSTSLPEDVQLRVLHSIKGLENARVIRYGYGIEHEVVTPTQLNPALETKLIRNLYLAGQINGTTGYEEAAALGLTAGINAALRIKNKEPLILDRASSYIGVLIDDLVTKGTNEPYRMFTSRVEYRLILREDNADLRLSEAGYNLGLLSKKDYRKVREKKEAIKKGLAFLRTTRVKPDPIINAGLSRLGASAIKKPATLEELLRRPEINLGHLRKLDHMGLAIPKPVFSLIETQVKYSGFIQRQKKDVENFRNLEKIKLPQGMDYAGIPGLSREVSEKLTHFLPFNLGQASRISGVTPAAISLLMVYLRKQGGEKQNLSCA